MQRFYFFLSLLLLSFPLSAQLIYDNNLAPFYHGVASGDPLPDGVLLWTRVTPPSGTPNTVQVLWQIATDTTFENIVQYGYETTNPNRDYTLKVDVDDLEADTYYYYRFYAYGNYSIVGRTRTTPVDKPNQLRFAVTSCANFADGYFTTFRKIAERNDLHAVIELGDYIYEVPEGEVRTAEPNDELLTLSDYRTRHAQHKLDPDLRAAHQLYPWLMIWDDHELSNNSWQDGASGHDFGEGDYQTRKQAAMRAYIEWNPIRLPQPDSQPERIYRTARYGGLADILLLDTRLIARDQQAFLFFGADDSDQDLLGSEQMQWLQNNLSNSNAQWKVIAQQVMMAPFEIADVRVNNDQWDGYTADRQALYDHIMNNNIENVVVLTGDIHSSWANDLPYSSSYDPNTGLGSVAAEFIAPSTTAEGFPFSFGEDVILDDNAHVKYIDLLHKGYFVLTLNNDRAQADWFYMEDVTISTGNEYYGASFYEAAGERWVRQTYAPQTSVEEPQLVPDDDPSPDVVKLKLKVVLQGAFDSLTQTMRTNLRANQLLPPNQPFNVPPFNYTGNEHFNNPNNIPQNAVDWVLVELRDTTNWNTILYRKAALLLNDGRVVDARATSTALSIANQTPYESTYRIVVRSRQHLATLSGAAVNLPNANAFDFSTAITQAEGPHQQVQVAPIVWAQYAGDLDHNGVINFADYNFYALSPSGTIYNVADVNMDGQVNEADFATLQPNLQRIGIPAVRE